MKKYCFSSQESYGAKKIFFEDEQENAVIIEAASPEEAESLLVGMVNDEFVEEAERFGADELPEAIMDYPFEYFVEWKWKKDLPASEWYGGRQKRSDYDENNELI